MSERLRKAYEIKEIERIKSIVQEKNKSHALRMKRAGMKFRQAHPEVFSSSK